MDKKFYNFGIKQHKALGYKAVVLADDTHIVFSEHKLTIGYPKKKFNEIFKKQMKDKNQNYLWVEFSEIELRELKNVNLPFIMPPDFLKRRRNREDITCNSKWCYPASSRIDRKID